MVEALCIFSLSKAADKVVRITMQKRRAFTTALKDSLEPQI
jgi:hypothetical protein